MNDILFPSSVKPQKHSNEELYHRQMEMLYKFLSHGTISQAQYDKSAGDLTRLMGFPNSRKAQKK